MKFVADKFTKNFITYPNSVNGGKLQYEDPTYLTFRLLFDFEENNGINDVIQGLLLNEEHDESAIKYLRRIKDRERSRLLKEFRSLLQEIQNKHSYFFKSIYGVQSLWNYIYSNSYNNELKLVSQKNFNELSIIVECLEESLDLRISALADLYRKSTYDRLYWRDLLPIDKKRFNASLIIGEFRNFSDLNNDKLNWMKHFSCYYFKLRDCVFDFRDTIPDSIMSRPDTYSPKFKINIGKVEEMNNYIILEYMLSEIKHELTIKNGLSGVNMIGRDVTDYSSTVKPFIELYENNYNKLITDIRDNRNKLNNNRGIFKNVEYSQDIVDILKKFDDRQYQRIKNMGTIPSQEPIINNNISNIESLLPNVNENISEINPFEIKINENISDISKLSPNINNNISNIEIKDIIINNNISEINKEIPNINENLSSISKKSPNINSFINNISDFKPQINENISDISKLSPNINNNISELIINSQNINLSFSEIQSLLPNINENISEINKEIPNINNKISELTIKSPILFNFTNIINEIIPKINNNITSLSSISPFINNKMSDSISILNVDINNTLSKIVPTEPKITTKINNDFSINIPKINNNISEINPLFIEISNKELVNVDYFKYKPNDKINNIEDIKSPIVNKNVSTIEVLSPSIKSKIENIGNSNG